MVLQSQPIALASAKEKDSQQESLAAAFAFFNETSRQLEQSYKQLENRVSQLAEELDKAEAEKKQASEERLQVETQMQALLDFLPGGVIVLDAKGYVLDANPAAKSLLEHELEGQLWRKAISDCFSPKNDDGLEVSTRSGKRISIATSSMGDAGQIILLTDLSETRKLQENLSRHQRLSAMGKMVSALAHQIRTPLSTAILYSNHLCKSQLDESKRQTFAEKLLGRLQHMEKQVQDMMLFVKSELPLNDIISLSDLELELREAAEMPLSTSDSACQWINHHPNSELKCHRDALVSALMNLINNAIQASGSQPKLTVEMSRCEHAGEAYVFIEVRDCGEGISPENLQEAQEMFVTTKSQGTGLGLSVVHSVAKAHGGSFKLSSVLNEGTSARLLLPVFNRNHHRNVEELCS